jgi:hypothetical protein
MPVINSVAFKKLHNIPVSQSLSLSEIAKLSGMPLAALKEVYSKGEGAYSSNPSSVRMKGTFKKGVNAPMSQKLSMGQWAMSRVYSFVMKRKSTFGGADKSIAIKYNLK